MPAVDRDPWRDLHPVAARHPTYEEPPYPGERVWSGCCCGPGGAPSDGTSLLLMAAQTGGAGSQAERVALGSSGRSRLSHARHMKYGHLFGPRVTPMDRAMAYFRKVMKESGESMGHALAKEGKFFCDGLRVLFTP